MIKPFSDELAPLSVNTHSALPASKPFSWLGKAIASTLRVAEFNALYAAIQDRHAEKPGGSFFDAALEILSVECEIDAANMERIPHTGPTVVVANHPHGFLDILVLGHLLLRCRPDVKIIAHTLLTDIKEAKPWIIGVDPNRTPAAIRNNYGAMRKAMIHLDNGGALAFFPAGTVASFRLSHLSVQEGPWKSHLTALLRRANASVTPIHFSGRNSFGYQAGSLVHPELRTALLPRELLNKKERTVSVSVGKVVTVATATLFDGDEAFMRFLRSRTLALHRYRTNEEAAKLPIAATATASVTRDTSKLASAAFRAEVADLPPDRTLVRLGSLSVFLAEACEIPWILQEIGWLREQTFREVGEGTGKAIDLDRFDRHYEHLFLWNHETNQVIGGYRLARIDWVMATEGIGGLYTHTLFKFRKAFVDDISPALEMGRSFIRPEYQRVSNALPLLWRGIGEYIARNPQYARLFVPVSISQSYDDLSRSILVEYLQQHCHHLTLSRRVAARHHFDSGSEPLADLRCDLGQGEAHWQKLSAIVAAIEADGRGIPTLLKHYLKLNGRVLAFNIDPAFSNSLDGLILIDLREAHPSLARRYLGAAGYQQFLHYHSFLS